MKAIIDCLPLKMICAMVLTFALLSHSDASDARDINVFLNQQKAINTPNIYKASIGNPAIATAKVMKELSQLLVTGISLGTTNLTIWDKNDQQEQISITVTLNLTELKKEIQMRINGLKGVYLRSGGSRIILSGTIYKLEHYNKILMIKNEYPLVVMDVAISDKMIMGIVSKIKKDFEDSGLYTLNVRKISKKLMLEGEVDDEASKSKALNIASAHFSNIIDAIQIEQINNKSVEVKVDFIEIDKTIKDDLGIKWMGTNTGVFGLSLDAVGGGQFSSPFVGSYNVSGTYGVIINAIKNNGRSRILAQPRIVCASGKAGKFFTGGEIPVPVKTTTQSSTSISFNYKPYGIALNIFPYVNNQNEIAMTINVEHSDLGELVDGTYSFNKSFVNTNIKVKDGQTIVLSGLLNQSNKKSSDEIKLLGKIPVLGKLFSSRSYLNGQNELVIFVTPTLIKNDHQPSFSQDIQNKFYEQNHAFPIMN